MTDDELRAWVPAVGITATLLIMLALTLFGVWPVERHAERDRYAFYLPKMFLQCMHYPLHGGETFSSWRIDQPMTLEGTAEAPLKDVSIYMVSISMMDRAFECPFLRATR